MIPSTKEKIFKADIYSKIFKLIITNSVVEAQKHKLVTSFLISVVSDLLWTSHKIDFLVIVNFSAL